MSQIHCVISAVFSKFETLTLQRPYITVLAAVSPDAMELNQSSDILQHSSNRQTGDRRIRQIRQIQILRENSTNPNNI